MYSLRPEKDVAVLSKYIYIYTQIRSDTCVSRQTVTSFSGQSEYEENYIGAYSDFSSHMFGDI
jgi:hypothetical protein